MWKRILSAFFAGLLAVAVVGCGANRSVEVPENPETKPEAEPGGDTAPPVKDPS